MTEGIGIKGIMTAPGPRSHFWSQYARVHDKLGVMRGPGVERELPVRRSYNVLTGTNSNQIVTVYTTCIRIVFVKPCHRNDVHRY